MNIGLNILGIGISLEDFAVDTDLRRTNAIDCYLLSPDLPLNAVTYSPMKFVTLT